MTTLDGEPQIQQACLPTILKSLLAHLNLSTNALAKEINLPPPTVHRILTGEVQDPRASTLISIADYFGISVDQLLGRKALGAKFNDDDGNPLLIAKPPFSIPVLTLTEAKEYEKYIDAPTDWIRWQTKSDSHSNTANMFSVLLKNNIYDPPFANGAYLIISPKTKPVSGDYVMVKFNNDPSAAIKKYISEGDQKYLYPLKQDLKSIPFDQNNSSIIGVIIETYLKLKD